MPSRDAILLTATLAATRWWMLAVAWHVALAIMLVALWRGWRPPRRVAAYLLTLPLLSVSALAWDSGNPFNATVFAALAGWLVWRAARLTNDPVSIGSPLALTAAVPLLVFAWAYPHFLGPTSWTYVIAAPLGVIPCPTLSALIGLVLMLDSLGSRTWGLVVGSIGVAYGLIGVWALRVEIDTVLVAGALWLLATAWTRTAVRPAAANARARRRVVA